MKPLPMLGMLLLTAAAPAAAQTAVPANTGECLNPQEAELITRINAYRAANGKAAVPASRSLSTVGQWHVWDLMANAPNVGVCNLHSFSNARPALWQPVCYTSDHAQAAQMWAKPRQITGGIYTGNGYENAYSNSGGATAAAALEGWEDSQGHREVILNQGVWASQTWRAMGVGVFGRHAVAWFGAQADPQGSIALCGPSGRLFGSGFEGG